MGFDKMLVPRYDKADRAHMRRLLHKASDLIDMIAEDRVPLGTFESAELINSLAASVGFENKKNKDDDELKEFIDDRCLLINLYAALKKAPAFLPLYTQLGELLFKYGLFDEEVVLLENAISDCNFTDAELNSLKYRLNLSLCYRDADDAALTDAERISEGLRRALRQKPLDESQIYALLKQCTDDRILFDIACINDNDEPMRFIRESAACLIKNRDYQYVLASQVYNSARTAMILNLFDSLDGDELFIARTILTDPDDRNKAHMLLYCKNEELLMLGWKYVCGARKFCADRLHAIGSRYPEAYEEMDPQEKAEWEENWLICASETAYMDILPEDDAVRERLSCTDCVNSDLLHLFISIHHPRKAVRWWHAKKLKNQVLIAYLGSWTSDDEIKKELSVRINNTELITEMIFGNLSAIDLVFAFKRPEDMTLQDRFCVEIMKNNPDRIIREHVRKELLRANVDIPGVDLKTSDSLYKQ